MRVKLFVCAAFVLFAAAFARPAHAQSCVQISSYADDIGGGHSYAVKNNCDGVVSVVVAEPGNAVAYNYIQPGQTATGMQPATPGADYHFWVCNDNHKPLVPVNVGNWTNWETPTYDSTDVQCK